MPACRQTGQCAAGTARGAAGLLELLIRAGPRAGPGTLRQAAVTRGGLAAPPQCFGDTLSCCPAQPRGHPWDRAGQGASATWEHSVRSLTASPKIKIIQLSACVYQAKEFTMFKYRDCDIAMKTPKACHLCGRHRAWSSRARVTQRRRASCLWHTEARLL